jgi:amidohydrolase
LIEWRRDFHRHPEIAFQEKRTSAVIRKFFDELDIKVSSCAETGLKAVLEGKHPGKTVALRADMDALPLQEEGDKEYISQKPGVTHACAHDGHMAVAMGAAKLLSKRREELKGTVVFLFQPSEERIPGGAKVMIEEGALNGVDAVFGFHFWQLLPTGAVGVVKGPMMAQPDSFDLVIKGKGGHGSTPHLCVDPILVSSHVISNLQSIVSRSVDPLRSCVVSLGTIKGGTIYNIIPNEVSLSGTVRTFDMDVKKLVRGRIKEIVENTCKTFGATYKLDYKDGYPPVVNHPEMVDFMLDVTRKTLGKEAIRKQDPVMGGEDFAYFLQKVPGVFYFFGMGDGMEFPHHHPEFDMDEKALPGATHLLTSLALTFLQR